MNDLRHPLTCVVAASVAIGGAVIAGTATGFAALPVVAGGLISAIGQDKLAAVAGQGWDDWYERHLNRNAPLNHDLQAALQAAFADATARLEHRWFEEHPRGRQQRRSRTDGSAKALFGDLRRNAAGLFGDSWLREINEDLSILRRFRGRVPARDLLEPAIGTLLRDEDPQLADFLRKELAPQVAECFHDRLKRTDRRGARANSAFQFLVYDEMLANDEVIFARLAELGVAVERLPALWKETADQLRAERDALATLVQDEVRGSEDRLSKTVAEVGDRTVERVIVGVIDALDERLGTHVMESSPVAAEANDGYASPVRRPGIFEVPHFWNPHFVGRRDTLDELTAAFAARAGPAVLAQAIQGLGGVGKTQLAARFAYERMDDYAGVWWVQAESPTSLAAGYAALAGRLDLPLPDERDSDAVAAAVRRYLEGTGETGDRWLLIFDNAVPGFSRRDPHGALDPYLPRRGLCDVLITSRERDWRGIATPLDVDILPADEAVAFLQSRTGNHDEEAARELADELGRLPLALEQAGAYIADKQGLVTLTSYLAQFRRQPLDRLSLDPAKTGKYGEVVATTWIITYGEIEQRSAAGADLLKLCAFLGPEAIPLDDLVAHSELLPEPLASALRDPHATVEAVDLLLRFSLAEGGESRTLNVHRLVQLVVREWLTIGERENWAAGAVEIANASVEYDRYDVRSWSACERILNHGLAASQHAEELGVAAQSNVRLLDHLGLYLRGLAQWNAAQAVLVRAVRVAEEAFGADHRSVATSVSNLASVLYHKGDLVGARDRHERALAIWEAADGTDHPSVATCLVRLAEVLREQGDLARARKLNERALAIHEAVSDPDDAVVASGLIDLAETLWRQGDLVGARERFERALPIIEATHGPEHLATARVLVGMANVLRDQGELAKARHLTERALAIFEANYGPDDPWVARIVTNLSLVLRQQGDLAGARSLINRALASLEAAYGPDHYTQAVGLTNLADVLRDQGDQIGAKQHYERALAILEATLGPKHFYIPQALLRLGQLQIKQNDLVGARERFERALAVHEEILGPTHLSVANDLDLLAGVQRQQGDLAGARSSYVRALEIHQARRDEHKTISLLYALAGLEQQAGHRISANRWARQALVLSRSRERRTLKLHQDRRIITRPRRRRYPRTREEPQPGSFRG